MGHLLPTKGEWASFGLLIILILVSVYALIVFSFSERFMEKDDPVENYFDKVTRIIKENLK